MSIILFSQILNTIFFGILGLVIGSFLNVCIYRIPEGRTIVKGHSMCMTCGHNLGTLDLFPLFSWLLLKGKCRYCGAPIASRYAKIEGLTGIVFAVLAWKHRDAYILLHTSLNDFAKFGILFALLGLASAAIVAMMIQKDHGVGMYRFSVFAGILFVIRIVLGFLSDNHLQEIFTSAAISGVAGLILIALLILFISPLKKSLRTCFSDIGRGITVQSYFSAANRGLRTSDLFFLSVSTVIGFPAAVPCLLAYTIVRIAGRKQTFLRYYGIVLAAAAWIGVLFFPNSIF